ncbi:phosphopantetheine-binding protein [Streptomyces sp. NPDC047046]|uniref:acyl carrier protein n=1 Tax=Streptomyces sp. NPDC047046 TaxID=3155378 RepID=UPI0033EA477E
MRTDAFHPAHRHHPGDDEEDEGTVATNWDETYEKLVRAALTDYPPTAPLRPDLPLPAHGLDSLGMVGLSARLEDAYDIEFPDGALVPASFATPAELWRVVGGCLDDR